MTPDLTGATVLVVQPGDRVLFVATRDNLSRSEVDQCLAHLRKVLPDNEVHIVVGFDQVIHQPSGTTEGERK